MIACIEGGHTKLVDFDFMKTDPSVSFVHTENYISKLLLF